MGSRHYLFRESETPFNNISSSNIAANKYCTSKLLEKAGIPVPNAVAMHVDDFRQNKTKELVAGLKFPLVLKPLLDGSKGKDVLCNIQSIDQLIYFLNHYFSIYEFLMIEEFHGNLNSYRVLVFNRRVIGVVQRYPAFVTGDGTHNIEELVELTNKQRKIINDFLGPIVIDDEGKIKLNDLGKSTDYVPSVGERVILAYTSNATRGGTYESLGNQMCKENRKLMSRVASILNLGLAGIDVECTDINIPISQSHGVIIEVNHRPSIRIHELPLTGKPHLVTKTIMRSFIYRHPFSYLYALYTHRPTAFYMRAFTVSVILGVLYWLAV
ncbi:UDP-N-acetylmuramyl peptide synthase [Legionella quateirensis]|nr:UDP-N-acetylmuramyl peptide synthase [Legionella quateirensis]